MSFSMSFLKMYYYYTTPESQKRTIIDFKYIIANIISDFAYFSLLMQTAAFLLRDAPHTRRSFLAFRVDDGRRVLEPLFDRHP